MDEFYLDANAGLPARDEALAAFEQVARKAGGNPASLHRAGRRAHGELERARETVARCLQASSREVVFTSGATEACNLALFGMIRARQDLLGRPLRVLSSLAEHPAVIGPLRVLQQEGHRLQLLNLDRHGRVDERSLQQALQEEEWDFVAMQWANNETGAIQPLGTLVDQLPTETLWFCDSVQAWGKLAFEPAMQRADAWTASGHKFRAPHGVGVLVLRDGTLYDPPLVGGGHQRNRRPGTETPELAAALATALEFAMQEQADQARTWLAQSKVWEDEFRAAFPELVMHHPAAELRLANTMNFGFPGLDGRMLLPALDAEGLYVSAGSACSSGSPEPSPVLLASGVSRELATASIRVSLPPGLSDSQNALACQNARAAISRVYEVANR